MSWLVFLVSLLAIGSRLNSWPLKNWDEAWYAQIVHHMSAGTSPLVPFWNGQYYFDKPPLAFWLNLPIIKIFGEGEWQFRLVSVLAGAFSVLLIFKLTQFLTKKTQTSLLASLIFLTTNQVIRRFGEGDLDSLLICFLLLFLYLCLIHPKKTFIQGLIFGSLLLIKSPLMGVFVLSFLALLTPPPVTKYFRAILLGAFLYILYLVFGYLKFGQVFLSWYLFSPDAGRLGIQLYFDPIYLQSIVRDFGFWWLILALSLPHFKPNKLTFSLLLPISLYVLLLHFSFDRFDWYLLPIYPFLALIFAQYLSSIRWRPIFISIVLFQTCFLGWQILADRDRSIVGATLGREIAQLNLPTSTLYLDDPDYPSFMYYSKIPTVISLVNQSPKTGEWWLLKSDSLTSLLQNTPSDLYFVTDKPSKFFLPTRHQSQVRLSLGYYLVRSFYP